MSEEVEPGFEVLPQPPRRGHGRLWASILAVVVLAAGGAISYVAFAAGDHGGASSPNAAIQNVVDDLQNRDLIGLLDDLAPGERAALSGAVNDSVASLKRLGVLSSSVDPTAVSGWNFAAHNLTYGNPVVVNDHVQIVQITGGSIDTGGNAAQLPLTQRFLQLTKAPDRAENNHVVIGHPVRLAAEKVDGGWYASLFYTAADEMAHHAIPTADDAIPSVGADSPSAAVDKLIESAFSGDLRSAFEVVSPAELGALHDYGGLVTARVSTPRHLPFSVKKINYTTTPISDGERVSVHDLTVTAGGRQFAASIDGSCVTVEASVLHKKFCASDAADAIGGFVGAMQCSGRIFMSGTSAYHSRLTIRPGSSPRPVNVNGHYVPLANGRTPSECSGPSFTAAQKQAITDLVSGLLTSAGVDTAQVGGQWYVTPVRTIADSGAALLSALKGDDLFQLASIGDR
jgi:hypothetical protein